MKMDIQTYLKEKMNERKTRNRGYSLRAFARDLEVSPSYLSDILNRKKPVSTEIAQKFFTKLKVDRLVAKSMLLESLDIDFLEIDESSRAYLEECEFKLISEWHYFAILGLAQLKENSADPKWISRQLLIPELEAWVALKRLSDLGYIKIEGTGFKQSGKPLITTTDIPSASIRENHIAHMNLAIDKINEVDIQLREYTNITFATRKEKIPEAKRLIREFRDQLSRLMETNQNEEVYNLSIQLFPLTRPK